MIMEIEDTRFGENGVIFMADCGVIPERMLSNWPTLRFRPACWRGIFWG